MVTRRKTRAARVAQWIIGLIALGLLATIIVLATMLVSKITGGNWGGGEIVVVPDVVGLPEDQAVEALKERSLVAKKAASNYNDDQSLGKIFKQNPRAGAKVKQGKRVNIWLSLGPSNFIVPNLIGMQYLDAATTLADSGLILGKARKIYTTNFDPGEVLNQQPIPGRELTSQTVVDFWVADNKPVKCVVPSLVGKSLASAEELLSRRNLHLSLVNYVGTDSHPSGTVIGQSKASESSVDIGTQIELDVAIPIAIKEARTKSLTLSITVPPGPPKQRIKIKLYDELGEQVLYNEEHAPGYKIEKRLNVEGAATVMVFIVDMSTPYRQDKL